MRTTMPKFLLNLILCGGALVASAQAQTVQDTDSTVIDEMVARFSREYNAKYQKAVEMAKLNGWPLSIEKPNGSVSVLRELYDERTPLYYTTYNEGSAITSRVNKIRPGGSMGLNLDGSGMVAGVWEIGGPMYLHKDLEFNPAGAKKLLKADGTPGTTTSDHATHVCGTIGSTGQNSANFEGRGMAPKIKNIFYYDIIDDLKEMGEVWKLRKIPVSNHSYGPDISNSTAEGQYKGMFGTYLQDSSDFDEMTYKNPYYQPLNAAGNDRNFKGGNYLNPGKNGHDLMARNTVAKNSLVVAAVEEVLSYTDASSVKMSSFSNWGPTDDNRIKPTISAKGVHVYSTFNTNDTSYEYLDGTSMATPGVVGSVVLLHQHYKNIINSSATTPMKSATVRGLLAHTADEAWDYPGPDSRFGYGLFNAAKAVALISDKALNKTVMEEKTLSQRAVYTRTVYASGTEPLVATLSWTELPGTVYTLSDIDVKTPVLVNDLDIRVWKDDEVYYPWRLTSSLDAAAEKGDNLVDNIEKLEIETPVAGVYTITISHKGLLTGSNGLSDSLASQDFSLIVSGTDETLNVEKNDFDVFNVWPNPVSDVVNVSIASDLNEDAFVTLYDIQGKRMMSQKLGESSDSMSGVLNVSNLVSGVYLVKVVQGEKQSVRKIVKK